MKKLFIVLGALFAISGPAFAQVIELPTSNNDPSPTVMIGIAFEFGDGVKSGGIGFTAKVISTNRPDEFVVGAGLSYFPWSADKNGQIGFDLSAGYNFDNATVMGGYDFLRWKPQISVGYSWTEEEEDVFRKPPA